MSEADWLVVVGVVVEAGEGKMGEGVGCEGVVLRGSVGEAIVWVCWWWWSGGWRYGGTVGWWDLGGAWW